MRPLSKKAHEKLKKDLRQRFEVFVERGQADRHIASAPPSSQGGDAWVELIDDDESVTIARELLDAWTKIEIRPAVMLKLYVSVSPCRSGGFAIFKSDLEPITCRFVDGAGEPDTPVAINYFRSLIERLADWQEQGERTRKRRILIECEAERRLLLLEEYHRVVAEADQDEEGKTFVSQWHAASNEVAILKVAEWTYREMHRARLEANRKQEMEEFASGR